MIKVTRLQKPRKYKNYQAYKSYLRLDFIYSCGYCVISEAECGSYRNFAVDHYKPKKKYPASECNYDNLFYACLLCNCFKGQFWPTTKMYKAGIFCVNPCDHKLDDHFEQKGEELVAKTPAGQWTIDLLKLNSIAKRTMRNDRKTLKALIDSFEKQLTDLKAILKAGLNVQQRRLIQHQYDLVSNRLEALNRRFGRQD